MRKHFTQAEYQTVKAHLTTQAQTSLRAQVLLLLLVTGIRQCELCRLRIENFDIVTEAVTVHAAKRSLSRRLPLSHEVLELIKPVLEGLARKNCNIGELITDTMNEHSQTRAVQRMWRGALIQSIGHYAITAHGARHTFALRVLETTDKNLQKTQMAMGHKNINSTVQYLVYLQMDDLRDDVLKAVK